MVFFFQQWGCYLFQNGELDPIFWIWKILPALLAFAEGYGYNLLYEST
jgi:hypothetical protein